MLPAVLSVILQLPLLAASVPEQLSPLLALTVTLPVGLVTFVIACTTLKLTVTASPAVEEFGVVLVMALVVSMGLTVKFTSSVTVV